MRHIFYMMLIVGIYSLKPEAAQFPIDTFDSWVEKLSLKQPEFNFQSSTDQGPRIDSATSEPASDEFSGASIEDTSSVSTKQSQESNGSIGVQDGVSFAARICQLPVKAERMACLMDFWDQADESLNRTLGRN